MKLGVILDPAMIISDPLDLTSLFVLWVILCTAIIKVLPQNVMLYLKCLKQNISKVHFSNLIIC